MATPSKEESLKILESNKTLASSMQGKYKLWMGQTGFDNIEDYDYLEDFDNVKLVASASYDTEFLPILKAGMPFQTNKIIIENLPDVEFNKGYVKTYLARGGGGRKLTEINIKLERNEYFIITNKKNEIYGMYGVRSLCDKKDFYHRVGVALPIPRRRAIWLLDTDLISEDTGTDSILNLFTYITKKEWNERKKEIPEDCIMEGITFPNAKVICAGHSSRIQEKNFRTNRWETIPNKDVDRLFLNIEFCSDKEAKMFMKTDFVKRHKEYFIAYSNIRVLVDYKIFENMNYYEFKLWYGDIRKYVEKKEPIPKLEDNDEHLILTGIYNIKRITELIQKAMPTGCHDMFMYTNLPEIYNPAFIEKNKKETLGSLLGTSDRKYFNLPEINLKTGYYITYTLRSRNEYDKPMVAYFADKKFILANDNDNNNLYRDYDYIEGKTNTKVTIYDTETKEPIKYTLYRFLTGIGADSFIKKQEYPEFYKKLDKKTVYSLDDKLEEMARSKEEFENLIKAEENFGMNLLNELKDPIFKDTENLKGETFYYATIGSKNDENGVPEVLRKEKMLELAPEYELKINGILNQLIYNKPYKFSYTKDIANIVNYKNNEIIKKLASNIEKIADERWDITFRKLRDDEALLVMFPSKELKSNKSSATTKTPRLVAICTKDGTYFVKNEEDFTKFTRSCPKSLLDDVIEFINNYKEKFSEYQKGI